ncbi:MAG: hypothetical protein JSV90_01445 [Methanobacteriota archaeon]|nr:MAG: hypothetical protein JSV90_01445 [Euryarchaeota archaeon]
MSGSHDRSADGQLALMDALVFFAVAMLICSIQIARLHRELSHEEALSEVDARYDPLMLLHALLRTSIGCSLTLDTEPEVAVRPQARVADCLATQAIGLMSGQAPSAFEDMNGVILAIASSACAPLTAPTISVSVIADGEHVLLFLLGGVAGSGGDRYAASIDLVTHETGRIVVTLVLHPALLPEALGV